MLALFRELVLGCGMLLAGFVGGLDEASPLARFLSLFDVFVLWWIVVLAIGLAVLYQARARAVAAPRPEPAPVTMAGCPLMSIAQLLSAASGFSISSAMPWPPPMQADATP